MKMYVIRKWAMITNYGGFSHSLSHYHYTPYFRIKCPLIVQFLDIFIKLLYHINNYQIKTKQYEPNHHLPSYKDEPSHNGIYL